ncbi:hypothetical protein [Reichenbachiella ulvae]|uniref:Uncharacterized protein n=1 Tax=Reichenbachiella ulvae TaxID=2980104 RepID=A0ABT3CNM8_9BACT|nr:hypothetical protein [Reichenbachiella ulvae]MCV9385214.1 hypothetical protein [Reichenbachiella ulvae]
MHSNKMSHDFHIPVMGLAFTIDSPIKVAKFGISSVISIVQDNLIEKMRKHYYQQIGEPFVAISEKEEDSRARRITDYLNLVNRIVKSQIEKMKASSFGEGSDLDRYFQMLPDHHQAKRTYKIMKSMTDKNEKERLITKLKSIIQPGSIDVNIMTKLDKPTLDTSGEEIVDGSDAVTALRGYAKSDLTDSTIVLSAGMNPRLFAYMEDMEAFSANADGSFDKKIAIKVSDYRSALVQGKMLAKKGLWVSEFRIESGLNCGGHAFATDGFLLGPILEEFKSKREELQESMYQVYSQTIETKGGQCPDQPHEMKITVQGGVGSQEEQVLMIHHYGADSVGWGTPFLLVPEATTVDSLTLDRLADAREKDVVLSKNSPLGVRFNYLKGTSSEEEKYLRISKGKPGSPCTEKYLVSNVEFGKEPICTASIEYQKKKLKALKEEGLAKEEYERQKQDVLDKECLCVGLSNSAVHEYELDPFKNRPAVNICPGPNIAYFSEIVSLSQMLDHIYGRIDLMRGVDRPHMFIKELNLYVDYWLELIKDELWMTEARQLKYVNKFYKNLMEGIQYYETLAVDLKKVYHELSDRFTNGLDEAKCRLEECFALRLAEPELA